MSLLPLPDDLTAPALAVMLAGLGLAALARGYSGFGFSAILVSSWALVTDPARAVVVALFLEVSASAMQAVSVWKEIPWKRVSLLMAGAIAGRAANRWDEGCKSGIGRYTHDPDDATRCRRSAAAGTGG